MSKSILLLQTIWCTQLQPKNRISGSLRPMKYCSPASLLQGLTGSASNSSRPFAKLGIVQIADRKMHPLDITATEGISWCYFESNDYEYHSLILLFRLGTSWHSPLDTSLLGLLALLFKHNRPVAWYLNPTLPLPLVRSTPTRRPTTKLFHHLHQHTVCSWCMIRFGRAGRLWRLVANFWTLQIWYIRNGGGLSWLSPRQLCV